VRKERFWIRKERRRRRGEKKRRRKTTEKLEDSEPMLPSPEEKLKMQNEADICSSLSRSFCFQIHLCYLPGFSQDLAPFALE
jgi:hypothetical protein